MTRLFVEKNSFTSGEITPELYGRNDLRAYKNGARTLRNVVIQPTGGVRRRPGLAYIDTVPDAGRLVPFTFNTNQRYLLVFTANAVTIYRNGQSPALTTIESTPWGAIDLADISWTQSADSLLVTNPDIRPQRIARYLETGRERWHINPWRFSTFPIIGPATYSLQPFYKFAPASVTLRLNSGAGRHQVHLLSSTPYFTRDQIGDRLMVKNLQLQIATVGTRGGPNPSKQATAIIIGSLPTTDQTNLQRPAKTDLRIHGLTTSDWQEQAFSRRRGWPICTTFHQNRLVIGGSKSLPNRLWMSRSADLWNFHLGQGQDSDAIVFDVLDNQVNAIRAVFSGRHLQIFTTGGEWIVSGDILTPKSVQVRRQTKIGIYAKRNIAPQEIDGATVFPTRSGRHIREFLYTDLEQAYQSIDLALLSSHLVHEPLDQDFDSHHHRLYMTTSKGIMVVGTLHRAEQVTGWTALETEGKFLSVAVVGSNIYTLVYRQSPTIKDQGASTPIYTIERFDNNLNTDCTITFQSGRTPNLTPLEGHKVNVLIDGISHNQYTVTNSTLSPDSPISAPGENPSGQGKSVQIGLSYTHRIEPLPLPRSHARLRLIRAIFRLQNSTYLTFDTGDGMQNYPLFRLDQSPMDQPIQSYSGDIDIRGGQWREAFQPLWRIIQNSPTNFSLLSTTTELKVIR